MRARLALAALVPLLLPLAAAARPVTLAGITFSDELGGVVLHDGWGSGTTDDPFTLVEEITEDGPAVLVVRGMKSRLGDAPDGRFQHGMVVRKIVTNATTHDWMVFELELRETFERTSSYEDGLSFGQALAMPGAHARWPRCRKLEGQRPAQGRAVRCGRLAAARQCWRAAGPRCRPGGRPGSRPTTAAARRGPSGRRPGDTRRAPRCARRGPAGAR